MRYASMREASFVCKLLMCLDFIRIAVWSHLKLRCRTSGQISADWKRRGNFVPCDCEIVAVGEKVRCFDVQCSRGLL
jgi:hypothetical protein